jgi:hypothetical protein
MSFSLVSRVPLSMAGNDCKVSVRKAGSMMIAQNETTK